MSKTWICAAVYAKHSEIELSERKRLKDFSNASLIRGYCDLLSHLGASNPDAVKVLVGLIARKRYTALTDVSTSAFFGPKTMRVQYVLDKMNVFPMDRKLTEGKTTFRADGLTTVINGAKIRANVQIDVVISIIPAEEIDSILKSKPFWFCGELDLGPSIEVKPSLSKGSK
ncbi:TPA_asm: M [Pelargonium alphacytorhabdovirus 1]|nr:TPA_asm: M [Pelargonium alphacytorhabdovirus 1]